MVFCLAIFHSINKSVLPYLVPHSSAVGLSAYLLACLVPGAPQLAVGSSAQSRRNARRCCVGGRPSFVHPPPNRRREALRAANSSRESLQHTAVTTYRCYLPVLTGFVGCRCTGPSLQRRLPVAANRPLSPRVGLQPRYSGFRVTGHR